MEGRPSWSESWWPYEQTGYLVDGLTRAAILLEDDRLMAEVRPSLAAAPPSAATERTLWPISVYGRARMARDGDARSLAGFFRGLPLVLPPGRTREREFAIIEGMCQAGDPELVRKAEGYWRQASVRAAFPKAEGGGPNPFNARAMRKGRPAVIHGVTAAEVGKLPAILYLATGKRTYLRQALGFFRGVLRDHLLVDGAVSSAEFLGGRGPTEEHETCCVNDMMWAGGYLLEATGDAAWGDRIERAFFNAAMGAVSKNFRSFQYFSAPNQAFATEKSTNARFEPGGTWGARQAYRPGNDTECCAGNVHRLLPTYAARMWMTAPDGGPVAALFGPSRFRFGLGEVEEETNYPFSGEITFRFHLARAVRFTFRYRQPGWSGGRARFVAVTRTWQDGEALRAEFPMEARIEPQPGGGVSVVRGPLVFTPLIEECAEAITDGFKCSEAFPAYNLTPGSPWNLAIRTDLPVQETVRGTGGAFPWDIGAVPFVLKVPCAEVPGWTAAGRTPPLPQEPVQPETPVTIPFVPSGATRLRMDVLPACSRRP